MIPIRTIAAGCQAHQLLLRQFSLQCILYRYRWVGCPGDPHSLIHICTSGKRIPDRAAKASGGTSKRFNFRWMVVSLIFKINQPLFLCTIHLYGNYNAACIDLIRFLLIRQFSLFLQFPHCHQCQIHQTNKFILPALKHLTVIL